MLNDGDLTTATEVQSWRHGLQAILFTAVSRLSTWSSEHHKEASTRRQHQDGIHSHMSSYLFIFYLILNSVFGRNMSVLEVDEHIIAMISIFFLFLSSLKRLVTQTHLYCQVLSLFANLL